MTYLYVETSEDGIVGVSTDSLGDNAWTNESDWEDVRSGYLRVFRLGESVDELQPDGSWKPAPAWYRT